MQILYDTVLRCLSAWREDPTVRTGQDRTDRTGQARRLRRCTWRALGCGVANCGGDGIALAADALGESEMKTVQYRMGRQFRMRRILDSLFLHEALGYPRRRLLTEDTGQSRYISNICDSQARSESGSNVQYARWTTKAKTRNHTCTVL